MSPSLTSSGFRLLAYVAHFKETLSVVHGILIELENLVHDQDSYEVKNCIRNTLGENKRRLYTQEINA